MVRSLILMVVLLMISGGCSQEVKESANLSAVEEADLFKKASKAEIDGQFEEAVELYVTIADKCPDSSHRDKALFMAGFLKSENLGQKQEALKYFKELLKEYPNSDLSDDAEFMVEAIESDKDVISTFEEKTTD